MNKQLEALTHEFAEWRSQREKRTTTPDSLIAKALSLRGQVSDSDIVRYLGINRAALYKWAKQEITHETPTHFVELTHAPKSENNKTTGTLNKDNISTLNVALPSGVSLSLTGNSGALVDFVVQLTQQGAL